LPEKNKIIINKFWMVALTPSMIPENLIVFFSGIFLATGINIATKNIPEKLNLPTHIFISMVFMLISSFLLAIWAAIIKTLKEEFNKYALKTITAWRDMICPIKNNKLKTSKGWKLLIIEAITITSMVLSVIFLFIRII